MTGKVQGRNVYIALLESEHSNVQLFTQDSGGRAAVGSLGVRWCSLPDVKVSAPRGQGGGGKVETTNLEQPSILHIGKLEPRDKPADLFLLASFCI